MTSRPPPDAGFGRLGGLRRYRADPPGTLAEARRRCGDVATFRIGPNRVHPVAHPDLASRVLVADAPPSGGRRWCATWRR